MGRRKKEKSPQWRLADWLSRFVGHQQSLEIQGKNREKGKKQLSTQELFNGSIETDRSSSSRQLVNRLFFS